MKNKLRRGLASDEEHNFKTRAGIPSGSEDFGIEIFKQSFNFPCSNMNFRHSAWGPWRKGKWLVRLGKWWIFRKHFSQNIGLFNRVREGLAIFYQMRYGWGFCILHRFDKLNLWLTLINRKIRLHTFARGVIHIDYLQKGRTINGEYYTNLLDRFNEDLKKKRPHLAKKKVFSHQDNAIVHTCFVSMAKFHDFRYKLLVSEP